MYEAIGKEFGLWTVLDKSSYRAANGNLLLNVDVKNVVISPT